jgi:hypothetical protein
MASSWLLRLGRLNLKNYYTFRAAPLAEISGSLGDLGTLLPLMIALAIQGSIDLGATLVFSGIFNVLTGIFFGVPLPVQPMKVSRWFPGSCRGKYEADEKSRPLHLPPSHDLKIPRYW